MYNTQSNPLVDSETTGTPEREVMATVMAEPKKMGEKVVAIEALDTSCLSFGVVKTKNNF